MNIQRIVQKITSTQTKKKASILVAIAGGSSLGKTSGFVPLLKKELEQQFPVTVIHQDQFRDFSIPKQEYHTIYQGDSPDIYQLELTKSKLELLKSGQTTDYPGWKFEVDAFSGKKQIIPFEYSPTPSPVILFEGFYALFSPLDQLADLSIYLEGPTWSRFIRRIIRNWIERGYGDPYTISKYFLNSVLPAHEEFVHHQREKADFKVSMSYTFEDSISKFRLSPLDIRKSQSSPFFKFRINQSTWFELIYIIREQYAFYWIHENQIYVYFEVDLETALQIAATDWTAY